MTGWANPQLVDPIGGVAARIAAWGASIGAFVIAVGMSAVTFSEVSRPAFELAAFAALGAAGFVFVRASSPYRFPVSRTTHVVMTSLLLAAAFLDAVARWGANELVRDDWVPVCMGVIVIFLGVYRPAWEILAVTFCSCVVIAVLVAAQYLGGGLGVDGVPLALVVVVAITPVAAAGIATSAVAFHLILNFRQLRRRWAGERRDAVAGLRSRIAPEVAARRAALLDAEVTPYLRRLADSGELTLEDSDRARALASALRDTMVVDSGRTWLEELVDELDDPELLADRMSPPQRRALRAFVSELRTTGLFVDRGFGARLRAHDADVVAVVSARFTDRMHRRTPRLGFYAAVLRRFFPGARLDQTAVELRLEFEFRPM